MVSVSRDFILKFSTQDSGEGGGGRRVETIELDVLSNGKKRDYND